MENQEKIVYGIATKVTEKSDEPRSDYTEDLRGSNASDFGSK